MTLSTKSKIRLASLAFRLVASGRSLCGKALTGQFRRQSLLWELDLREVVDFMIYLSGGFEKGLGRFISKNTRPGDIVFDIGANIGAHTLPLARSVGTSGKVYAVEATEYAYRKLKKNISLNPSIESIIHPIHCILLAKDEKIFPMVYSSWPFDSEQARHQSHQGIAKSTGAAETATLDALVSQEGIQRIDLIKLDVDGNEWDVLDGGRRTIARFHPLILMELAPDYNETNHRGNFNNLHTCLKEHGYNFYNFRGIQLPDSTTKLASTISAGSSRNVVVKHKDDIRKLRFN